MSIFSRKPRVEILSKSEANQKFDAIVVALKSITTLLDEEKLLARETLHTTKTIERDMIKGIDMEEEPAPQFALPEMKPDEPKTHSPDDYINTLKLARDRYARTKSQRSAVTRIINTILKSHESRTAK